MPGTMGVGPNKLLVVTGLINPFLSTNNLLTKKGRDVFPWFEKLVNRDFVP